MSYKTDRLVELFPDAYAASDPESLLYKLLDVIGAGLMTADEAVKALLKSHWVNYAEASALDALGTIYGLSRRRLRDGSLETDAAFRLRLKSVVDLFVGGGTPRAVRGAVQSALGLPFDLAQLNLPESLEGLRQDLETLVRIEEFSPTVNSVVGDRPQQIEDAAELVLEVEAASVQESTPQIRWRFLTGSGRRLTLERLGSDEGIRSTDELVIPPGATLTLSSEADGLLSAIVDGRDAIAFFTNLDGSMPARLPSVPRSNSNWKFRAQSGLFDLATFDNDETFDWPDFSVEFRWVRFQPLTFEVYVPYFLQEAVQALRRRHNYTGELFVFEGLPREQIQTVVNQTKAAGVLGSVQFTLNFFETHDQRERFRVVGTHTTREDANAADAFEVGSFNRETESHDMGETFVVGAVFDVASFDTTFGFQ